MTQQAPQFAACVIACSKTKLAHAAPAVELYTGALFKAAVVMARMRGLPIWVLSAKHGLVTSETVLEPYNQEASKMTRTERAAWHARVAMQLEALPKGNILLVAGNAYVGALHPRKHDIWRPLAHLGIGDQRRELEHMSTETGWVKALICCPFWGPATLAELSSTDDRALLEADISCPACGGAEVETQDDGPSGRAVNEWHVFIACLNHECGVRGPIARSKDGPGSDEYAAAEVEAERKWIAMKRRDDDAREAA